MYPSATGRTQTMGSLQAQNLTWGATEPEIAHWEPTEHQPPAGKWRKSLRFSSRSAVLRPDCSSLSSAPPTVNNIITVLGVLTFGLQLCLVLFFVFRCQRLDNKMQEVLKQANTASKGAGESQKGRSSRPQEIFNCV